MASGLGNHAIARSLGLSEKTVRNNVSNILVKLAVPTRVAAVARARDAGVGTGTNPARQAAEGTTSAAPAPVREV